MGMGMGMGMGMSNGGLAYLVASKRLPFNNSSWYLKRYESRSRTVAAVALHFSISTFKPSWSTSFDRFDGLQRGTGSPRPNKDQSACKGMRRVSEGHAGEGVMMV